MAIQQKELFNSYTHLFGAVASLALTVVLTALAADHGAPLAAAVFITTFSYFILFTSSFIYHAMKPEGIERGFWLRLDHAAIFIMMAGSYVGPMYIYGSGPVLWSVLAFVWIFAVLGIAVKMRHLVSPNWVNVAIYAPLCVASAVPIILLWNPVNGIPAGPVTVPISVLRWMLIAGLLMYGAGGIIYAARRPDVMPDRIGFHGIFHVVVLAAAGLHAVALYFSIRSYVIIRECLSRAAG
ncbi:MAG: hemolysin III family protein [Spirochaetes bacterium]|nr:hemolysin III family protein [Spirochaetota bacterium]